METSEWKLDPITFCYPFIIINGLGLGAEPRCPWPRRPCAMTSESAAPAALEAAVSGVESLVLDAADEPAEDEAAVPTFSFVHEIAGLREATGDAAREAVSRAAEGQALWLSTFWFAAQQRKHGVALQREGRSGVRVTGAAPFDEPDATIGKMREANRAQMQWAESVTAFEDHWRKQISAALKKVEVEDLGAMDAARLWEAIPEEDGAGRGRKDLAEIEKELSIKVCFCEGDAHVLLVGAKTKLQKKAFALRNMLSHYHWRLSGRDVAFEAMTEKR